MKQTFSYWQKLGQLFEVLLPIFVTQVALNSTSFFNTVMAGHVSEWDLAGVAAGVNTFFPFFVAAMGIISGLTPTIAQLYGAGKRGKIKNIVQQGFYWALALGILFISVGWLLVPPLAKGLALEPRVEAVMLHYLLAISFGIIPVLLAAVLRNMIDAHGLTRLTMCITLVTVPMNIALNYLFMYGALGFPCLGGAGAGVGSAITWTLSLLLDSMVVCHSHIFDAYHVFQSFPRLDLQEWKKQLGVGIPIGATMFCESSVFGAVGLLMAAYGTPVMAAHQAALNFNSLVYMIPMSIGMAMTIIVGYEIGAARYDDARAYGRLGRVFSILFAGSLASILIDHRAFIAAIYTDDAAVTGTLTIFLAYAVGMQLADSINAPLQGILRGCKDVQVTFYLAAVSYWLIGLPFGWCLAHRGGLGPYGYWVGLIAGLLIGAVCLMVRLQIVAGKIVQK
jgi:MATE family multidrug resistance protein